MGCGRSLSNDEGRECRFDGRSRTALTATGRGRLCSPSAPGGPLPPPAVVGRDSELFVPGVANDGDSGRGRTGLEPDPTPEAREPPMVASPDAGAVRRDVSFDEPERPVHEAGEQPGARSVKQQLAFDRAGRRPMGPPPRSRRSRGDDAGCGPVGDADRADGRAARRRVGGMRRRQHGRQQQYGEKRVQQCDHSDGVVIERTSAHGSHDFPYRQAVCRE